MQPDLPVGQPGVDLRSVASSDQVVTVIGHGVIERIPCGACRERLIHPLHELRERVAPRRMLNLSTHFTRVF